MGQAIHYMERKSRLLPRAGDQLALRLREHMDDHGLTAKALAAEVKKRTGYSLDYRTVQNAMGGGASLDTFAVLSAFLGWDFSDAVLEPIHGASRLASLEQEIAHERAIMAARERDLARHQAADRARGATQGGTLRLVAEDDRSWAPRPGRRSEPVG